MLKSGWTGKILRVNLDKEKANIWRYNESMAMHYLGGRGFAVRILWDHLKPGTDPLHPNNLLIFAVGPLTGLPLPSSGKMVIAAKSPLTGGYGDGNIGTRASLMMKKAGLDAIVVEGKAEKPIYIYVENDDVAFYNASDLWGLNVREVHKELTNKHGKNSGVLTIGKTGENLVRFATVMSEEDRAGGRPGMAAVMGSKKIKALVIRGNKPLTAVNYDELRRLGVEAYKDIKNKPLYSHWMEQGTMGVYEWCQENSILPTYNFREGVFEGAEKMTGKVMAEKYKIYQKGCPNCNMPCGNMAEAKEDYKGTKAEMDYENVAMLSSNIGLDNMNHVIKLVREADDLGFDAISIGSTIAFTIEAYKKGLIKTGELDGLKPEWGDVETALNLMHLIANRKKLGNILAMGIGYASLKLGGGSERFAMHVKGLPTSAYNCHVAPGMALAFGTSSIGAHHKEAWIIAWEAQYGFDKIDKTKVEKVIELQRIRGGWFESFVACRLPWVEVNLSLDYYPKFMEAITGMKYSFENLNRIADRIYALIRAFWVREYGYWTRNMDMPPMRWFEEPLTKGPKKGAHLDIDAYNKMLDTYYEIRGWDENGIPKQSTFNSLGLSQEARELQSLGIKLTI